MTSTFNLRPLKAAELDPVYAWIEKNPLFAKYRMDRGSLASALERATADPEAVVLGAFAAATGSLLGFAWFLKRGAFGRSGYLRLIAVDPEAKTKGVGRALMESLEAAFLAPNGILLLATETNREAHAFYERIGYRKVGALPDYVRPGLTELLFYKSSSI